MRVVVVGGHTELGVKGKVQEWSSVYSGRNKNDVQEGGHVRTWGVSSGLGRCGSQGLRLQSRGVTVPYLSTQVSLGPSRGRSRLLHSSLETRGPKT